MMIVLYVLVIVALAMVEGWPLLRDRKWKELTVYSLFLIAGLAIIIMDAVSYAPFRVTKIIDYVFRPYFTAIKELLQ